MPGKVRTSASFYRRGIPNNFHAFGGLTQANYPIVQPQSIIFLDIIRNKNKYRNFLNIGSLNNRYF
jgi:hypothetical protein